MKKHLSSIAFAVLSAATFIAPGALSAADPIFSGPQPGEKTTSFKVIEIGGAADGKERHRSSTATGATLFIVD